MQTLYTYREIEKAIKEYQEAGGRAQLIQRGVLGCGDWLLVPEGTDLFYYVIREVYLNEWSSAQTLRRYRKLPKKYREILEQIDNSDLNID